MKKTRILTLVAMLVVFATLLTSCGGKKPAPMEDYLNLEYDLTKDVYSEVKNLSELEGYSIVETGSMNRNMLVFSSIETKADSVIASYKLFCMSTGKVVREFIGNKNTLYSFESFSDPSAILVKKTSLNASSINMEPDGSDPVLSALAAAVRAFYNGEGISSLLEDYVTETYTLFDASGAEIAVTGYRDEISHFADLVIYNGTAYRVDEKSGAWNKVMEIPEYMMLEDCLAYNEDYYYVHQGEDVIAIYDSALDTVSTFVLPNYSDESMVLLRDLDVAYDSFFLLNNGDMLCQYAITLDEDAKKYDFSWVEEGVTMKMDLVSLLISAEDGKVKELDQDYVICSLVPNFDLYDEKKEANENRYTQEFENLAVVAPIVDGKIMTSEDQCDLVLMDNKAKIEKSIQILDNQGLNVPIKIGDDLYSVSLANHGTALINGEGDVIQIINNSMRRVGAYFIGEEGIYTLSLDKVWDLRDPDVSYQVLGETILVTSKISSKEYKVEALRDGTSKTVYTHSKDSEGYFRAVEGFGYYYTVDEAENYKYYNEKGEELITTKRPLTGLYSSYEYGTLLLKGEPMDDSEQKVVYYAFVK